MSAVARTVQPVHRIKPASDTPLERLRILIKKRLSQYQKIHAFKENELETLLKARGAISALRAVIEDIELMERT